MGLTVCASAQTDSCCAGAYKKKAQASKRLKIIAEDYPKTVSYFNALKDKYPILQNMPILIWQGPCADANTIYFPLEWIQDLEAGNKFYLDTTEWVLLHEAGHIVYKDVVKSTVALSLAYAIGAISSIAVCIMNATREYRADKFAMTQCDNPDAWLAVYEFLDRYASLGFLPGITHSFKKYRLSLIANSFRKKFGYDLVIVPQVLDPVFIK